MDFLTNHSRHILPLAALPMAGGEYGGGLPGDTTSVNPGVPQLRTLLRRDYCGEYVYRNDTLERMMTDVGYIDAATGTHRCFVRDYQGNVRAVLDESGTMLEHDGYYPYGMPMAGWGASTVIYKTQTLDAVQPLKYTGKELDRMNGLDHYDFGARWYDAARIGTTTTDPMASKYPHLSPYAWCAGNPVRNIDPSGRIIKTVINDVDYIFKEVDGVYGLYDVDGNKYEDQGGGGPGDIILFALQDLQKGYWGDLLVCYLANSPMTININQIEKTSFDEVPVNEISPTSLSIDWYPSDQGPKYLGDNGNYEDYRPSYIALGHEMAHAFDIINKSIDTSLWFKAGKNNQECYKGEIFATQFENILRRAFGIPRRSYYYYEDMGNGNYVPYEISKIPRMTHLPYQLLKLINPQLP